MQKRDRSRTERWRDTTAPHHATEPGVNGTLSPRKAFVILVALIAVAATVALVTRPSPKSRTLADLPQSRNFALSDAEAIARFKELDQLRLRIYRHRDITLVPQYLTMNSRLRSSLQADIDELLKTQTRVRPHLRSLHVEVLEVTASEAVIRQVALQRPTFLDLETGEDVSRSSLTLRLVVEWTLQREDTDWRVHDSTVVSARKVKGA